MAGLQIKNVKSPEERRPFKDKGSVAVVNVGGYPVLFGTFEPGWKWSAHVNPIAGTESCRAAHLLYCMAGTDHCRGTQSYPALFLTFPPPNPNVLRPPSTTGGPLSGRRSSAGRAGES